MSSRCLRQKQVRLVWRNAPIFASGRRGAQQKPAKRKRNRLHLVVYATLIIKDKLPSP